MDGFPYVLAPVFSTPAFSTTASYSCFFQVLMHIPPVRSTPASSTPAISTLLSSHVVSTPAFSTPAFSTPPRPLAACQWRQVSLFNVFWNYHTFKSLISRKRKCRSSNELHYPRPRALQWCLFQRKRSGILKPRPHQQQCRSNVRPKMI